MERYRLIRPSDSSAVLGQSGQTLAEVGDWAWLHGAKHVHTRVLKGGLISAVVESWFPSGEHSYGLLLEDDIEVSPYFYVYIKLALLSYVYAGAPSLLRNAWNACSGARK